MKKLIISAIIASLLIPVTSFGAFSDVNSSTDYNNAIQWMADNGVIDGYPDGSFQPNRCVNRAELVKMVIEVTEQHFTPPPVNGNRYYPDVQQSDWFYGYVMNASNRGWVQGYPNGTFKPGNCVNRVEAIKIAILALNNGQTPVTPSGKATFSKPYDVDSTAWYFNYIMKAVNEDTIGLAHATYHGGGTYNYYPGDSMTRKEVAEMLYRMKAVRDNSAEKYSASISPNAIIQLSETNNYTNSEFDLSFDIPTGWSITEEYEGSDLTGGAFNQLRISLRPNNNGNVSISIVTPPDEIGYENLIITEGFNRNIDGLTIQNSQLMKNNENGILISKDSYYKNEVDWSSHIEFLFSAPQGTTFDGFLPDYYKVLDSIVY